MSTLVRRVKCRLRHSTDDTDLPPPLPPKDSKYQYLEPKRQSRCDLSTAVESAYSIQNRQRCQRPSDRNSISELRRRLVSKASTFGLRFRSPLPDPKDRHWPPQEKHQPFATDQAKLSSLSTQSRQLNVEGIPRATVSGTLPHTEPRPSSVSACSHITADSYLPPKDLESNLSAQQIDGRYQRLHQESVGKRLNNTSNSPKWSTMASESAAPPVAYERMKDIATSACDTALSSITKYNHADTESWNTTIINTILAALVEETTPSPTSQTPAGQPQFKYIVNSTIIQHASSSASIDDGSKASGRRGMHSASGAFWNNEKDGMWSFKYEAAEAKGLDVVVGIIWVWVG